MKEKDLLETLENYQKTDVYPFHMPGHKRQSLHFPNPYAIDITEIDGFDNLHHAEGILKEAQERAAELYGSRECFYLINGSTCGLLAAISAAAKRGETVLVARNCHKAVYHALFLRELSANYLYPVITENGIMGQITAEQVEEALSQDPTIKTVILTSPTYEGIGSDIGKISTVAHRHGAALIVDEAHGAHFGFGAGFPENAVRQGADAVIMSLHKTLPSFTQTALLHLCSDRISSAEVKKYLGIYETSSPSYLFMAGMDACVRMVKEQGDALFLSYRKKLDAFYQSVRGLKHLHVMQREDLSETDAASWDDSKIVIFAGTSGLTGEELHQKLLQDFQLQMEMASGDYVLAMTSLMDTEEGLVRLKKALFALDKDCKRQKETQNLHHFIEETYQKQTKQMEIGEAWNLPAKEVAFEEAAGAVSAEYIYLYPPGIPLIVPGEVITENLLDQIRRCQDMGLFTLGMANLSSGRINIVYF